MATQGELAVISKLIVAAKAKGFTLSVFDGEEFAVKRSQDEKLILEAVESVDESSILVRDKDGVKLGSILIILGNAADGSEVIADNSDNDVLNDLCDAAYEGGCGMNSTQFASVVVLDSPAASFFLKDAVKKAADRDVLDALRDAEVLLEYCQLRAQEAGLLRGVRK